MTGADSPLDPDPARALAGAEDLMRAGAGPARARTVARLLRYAVESALDEYWEAERPGAVPATVGRGRRLRLLSATLGREFAHDVYTTWCRLSDAARPHPYELAPSVSDLLALQRAAEEAVKVLAAAALRTERASGASCTSCT